jgi:ribose transport system permease protein
MNVRTDSDPATTPSVAGDDSTPTASEQMVAKPGRGRRTTDLPERVALLGAWAAMIVLFSILRPDTFGTTQNFQTIFGSQSVLVVLTLGLILPLVVGEFDLSIAATLGLSAALVAVLNAEHGWPIGLAVIAALAVGPIVGLVNGFLVVVVGVEALVATLGIGTLLTGLTYAATNYNVISGVDPGFSDFITYKILFGLPLSFYFALILATVLWYVFRYTPLGKHLMFTGAGPEVARLSGLRVHRLRVGAFVVGSLFAAFAGVILTGTFGSADANNGTSFLLPAFAAAFLGSTTIAPGRFNPWGTVVAVYFLVTGITGLQLLGFASWIQEVFYGLALVLAVTLSRLVALRVRS